MTQAKDMQGGPPGWAWYITRAQAIADGALIDAADSARQVGIGCPVAVTPAAYGECVWVFDRDPGRERARLCRLLESLRDALPPPSGAWGRFYFPVEVPERLGCTLLHLDAVPGTGDDGEPAVTVMLPCERHYHDEDLPLARRIHAALAAGVRPDDDGVVACLLETPEHHAALRHAVQVDGMTPEHLAGALWCGQRLRTLISPTNPHRPVFREFYVDDT